MRFEEAYEGWSAGRLAVDVAATVECISRLVADPGLRERMGRAGRARAREDFDWRLILGRYRELWSELAQRRLASSGDSETRPRGRPDRPDPFALFAAYPSRQLEGGDSLELVASSRAAADAALAERRALGLNAFARYVYPDAAECRSVIELVAATPGLAVETLLSAFPAARRVFIRRGLAWLMKMDILRFPR